MFDVDNYNITQITDFNDVHHLPQWFLWAFPPFSTVMVVLGLAGNSFVLYATVRYNAIELDRASVLYLQNLAVADILILIFYSLPFLLVLISRRWIIGEILCYLTFYITCIAGFVDNFTILGISCYRVWVLLCPFRPPPLLFTRLSIAFIWLASLLYSINQYVISPKIYYFPLELGCVHYMKSNNILDTIRHFFPPGGTILANIVILGIVLSLKPIGNETMNRTKPVGVVFGICFVYIVACTPWFIYSFANWDAYIAWFYRWGIMVSYCTLNVHLVFNPFIYTLTNKRFRHFVLNKYGSV